MLKAADLVAVLKNAETFPKLQKLTITERPSDDYMEVIGLCGERGIECKLVDVRGLVTGLHSRLPRRHRRTQRRRTWMRTLPRATTAGQMPTMSSGAPVLPSLALGLTFVQLL
jgi:hypothetical protein